MIWQVFRTLILSSCLLILKSSSKVHYGGDFNFLIFNRLNLLSHNAFILRRARSIIAFKNFSEYLWEFRLKLHLLNISVQVIT